MRLMMLFAIFSLCSCATIKRPDTDICGVNGPGLRERCYNILRDYDNEGQLLPAVKPEIRQYFSLEDMMFGVQSNDPKEKRKGLNKKTCIDPDGLANLKTYIQQLKDAYEKECK